MSKNTASTGSAVASFERALDELEQLVQKMEKGEQSLDESLAAYERGVALYRECQKALEQAEQRVRLLADPGRPGARGRLPAPMPTEPLIAAWRARAEAALAAVPVTGPRAPRLARGHAPCRARRRQAPAAAAGATPPATPSAPTRRALDAPATAVELVHAFSLVHDDLPAMDDDALRRGQPTVHVAFDEATAILAGDALQALAFAGAGRSAPWPPMRASRMVRELAIASGVDGMCAGQALDMDSHRHHASALDAAREPAFAQDRRADPRGGAHGRARGGCAGDARWPRSMPMPMPLGLAFQIRDDILDVEGDAAQLGKTAGKDAAQGKATYPGLLGLARARERLAELADRDAGGPRGARPGCGRACASWRDSPSRGSTDPRDDAHEPALLDQADREGIAVGHAFVGLHAGHRSAQAAMPTISISGKSAACRSAASRRSGCRRIRNTAAIVIWKFSASLAWSLSQPLSACPC